MTITLERVAGTTAQTYGPPAGPVPPTTTTLDFDAGDFKPGDRVRVTTPESHHNGALGRVVKVDEPDEFGPIIYPVVVWLDVFGTPNNFEQTLGFGHPFSANEIEKVDA